MKLAVLQPGYLPWLGFFDQLSRVDVFVLYDDVQYTRSDWRSRNRIKGPAGPVWLTVPVLRRFPQTILEARIDASSDWRRKHRETLRIHYRKAAYFERYWDIFEEGFARRWEQLVDLDLYFILRLKQALGLEAQLVRSSELGIPGEQVDRLVALCRHFKATSYLTGDAALDYLQPEPFEAAGVRVEYQRYGHPIYPQLYGAFLPYLSVVDLLLNCGPDSRAILGGGAAAPLVTLG